MTARCKLLSFTGVILATKELLLNIHWIGIKKALDVLQIRSKI